MSKMMTGEDLKNSILQMAMQGKLVEQRPEEGTGEELYQQIQEEKQILVKEGKIKKQKKLPPITEEEIPFEIPESWIFVRVGNVGSWSSGATPSRTHPEYYGGNIPWLKTGDLNDAYINVVPEHITQEGFEHSSVRLNPVGSVLMAMYGATIGKLGILNIEATTNQACCACICYDGIWNKYLFYYLLSQRRNYIAMGEGGAQPNISKEKIVNSIIPLPPLAEQKRIVAKIEELMPFVGKYSESAQSLTTLNSSFPSDLKKSILQLAVEGKLVSQDPNDEPASVLLERIKAEKEKLVKEGKIKKQKMLPPISEDEIPFDIPESWEWCRLGNLVEMITSGSRGWAEYYTEDGAIFLRMGNLSRGSLKLRLDKIQHVNIPDGAEGKRTSLQEGDLLFSITGDVGNTGLIPPDFGEAYVNQHTAVIRFEKEERNKYLPYMLLSDFCKKQYDGRKHGIKNSFRLDSLAYTIIPIPPIFEQERIVNAIEQSWDLVDRSLSEKM